MSSRAHALQGEMERQEARIPPAGPDRDGDTGTLGPASQLQGSLSPALPSVLHPVTAVRSPSGGESELGEDSQVEN